MRKAATDSGSRPTARVKIDLVDPLAVAVVRAELRRVLVREPAPLERLTAEHLAAHADPFLVCAFALAPQRLDKRPVLGEQVVVDERRRLVGRRAANDRHRAIVAGSEARSEHLRCVEQPL